MPRRAFSDIASLSIHSFTGLQASVRSSILSHILVRRIFLLVIPFLVFGTVGCPFFENPFPFGDDGGDVKHQEKDVSGKLALALGGVTEGADEIVFDEGVEVLNLKNEDPDLFAVTTRDGYTTYKDGRGGKVIAGRSGIGYVTPILSGETSDSIDPIQVTIPPQKLIQILIGEARGELDREATLESGEVKPSSVSVTGDAVGAVIRNRIDLINQENDPQLFLADVDQYGQDPPISYYEAVIEANDGAVYQFSPVDPDDPSQDVYLVAAKRKNLDPSLQSAYDQAVLTAADIFNGDTEDATGGSFAFYSPTPSQHDLLREAWENEATELPDGCGTSDGQFPALAPIQILILEGIAPSLGDNQVPSFVFIRSRDSLDPAVTTTP